MVKNAETRRNLHTHTHTHTHTCNLLLSPKQIGTICFAISILISAPLFATDIPSSASTADCKHTPLQVYSGTSNLEAGWTANTIQLHWYNGDDEIQNVPSASQSCVYDGTLTPPSTIPTKTGYTFKGWRVRSCFSGLDTSIDVANFDENSVRWKQAIAGGTTMYDYFGVENSSDLNPGEWALTFSYGIVKGIIKCSETSYAWGQAGSPSDTLGGNCWCSATSYTPNGGNSQCNVSSLSWVRVAVSVDETACEQDCAKYCANDIGFSGASIRSAVFGMTQ